MPYLDLVLENQVKRLKVPKEQTVPNRRHASEAKQTGEAVCMPMLFMVGTVGSNARRAQSRKNTPLWRACQRQLVLTTVYFNLLDKIASLRSLYVLSTASSQCKEFDESRAICDEFLYNEPTTCTLVEIFSI